MSLSPTAEGFRAAFRRPSLTFGEVSWRWVTGATATSVFFFGLFEFLKTLPVSNGELLLLRSRQPYLVGQAIAHILRGSMPRVVMSTMLAAILLALLWMIAGSVGRIATVRAMVDYFREKFAQHSSDGAASDGERDAASNVSTNSDSFHALVRLNFLRIAVALASLLGFIGAAILAGFVSTPVHPRPGLAFFLFLPMAALICFAWSSLNWLLSLAGMFAARDGDDVVSAISAAVRLCRERAGALAAVSTWSGLAHAVAFVAMSTVVSMPMAFATLVPWRLIVAAMILITLIYFVVADWVYTARLAGYVCIVEMPEALLAPSLPPLTTPPAPAPPAIVTTIDRDEPILSDVPMPVTP